MPLRQTQTLKEQTMSMKGRKPVKKARKKKGGFSVPRRGGKDTYRY